MVKLPDIDYQISGITFVFSSSRIIGKALIRGYPVRYLENGFQKKKQQEKNSDNNFLYLLNMIRKRRKSNVKNSVKKNKILQ